MAATRTQIRPAEAPLYVPREWSAPKRDVALDLLRGLAMVVLVVNHTALESPLRDATRAVVSAAEVLVLVSGVVSGMVFGRRWIVDGARATTVILLRRARKLYLASVVVVALVGAAIWVPGLETEALTFSPRAGYDAYAYDGVLPALLGIVTLEAGPWQFNILGYFIAMLALAPLVLHALARGHTLAVVACSAGLYLLGRATGLEVLPSQSERAFPLLIWQVLFVGGMVLGWHRRAVGALLRPRVKLILALAAGLAAARVIGTSAVEGWAAFERAHFHKTSLDLLRIVAMSAFAGGLYLLLRRAEFLGGLLLPLGRNSFYVFIMHVFVCLAIASLPLALPALGNVAVQIAAVALLCLMARKRFLFRWVPR